VGSLAKTEEGLVSSKEQEQPDMAAAGVEEEARRRTEGEAAE